MPKEYTRRFIVVLPSDMPSYAAPHAGVRDWVYVRASSHRDAASTALAKLNAKPIIRNGRPTGRSSYDRKRIGLGMDYLDSHAGGAENHAFEVVDEFESDDFGVRVPVDVRDGELEVMMVTALCDEIATSRRAALSARGLSPGGVRASSYVDKARKMIDLVYQQPEEYA